jgi:hypothetical protein
VVQYLKFTGQLCLKPLTVTIMYKRKLPLVKLPESVDLTLYLIREELKANRFFSGLHQLGLSDCFFQPHLSSAILAQLGCGECPDDLFRLYTELIDKHSEAIDEDLQSITQHTLEVYQELCAELKKREGI